MSEINSEEEFKQEIESEKVLIDYYAPWCSPCRQMEPVIEDLSKDKNVKKVNIDELPSVAESQSVMALPTFAVYENGEEVDRKTGAISKTKIENLYE